MKRMILAFTALLALCLSSVAAHADAVTLTLTNPTQNIHYTGGTLMFEATVTNGGATELFLNGDIFNVANSLVLDDSDFFLGFPLSLAAGESFTGNLFTLTVASGALYSQYGGSFSIVGGADGGAQDILATVSFAVNVVPEPSSALLVVAAMMAGLVGLRRTAGAGRLILKP